MTLRLVHDDNVEKLEVSNLLDVASCAREFGDEVEAGKFGHVRCAIVILDTADGMHQVQWGESVSMFEALGMLNAAAITSYHSNFEEE